MSGVHLDVVQLHTLQMDTSYWTRFNRIPFNRKRRDGHFSRFSILFGKI